MGFWDFFLKKFVVDEIMHSYGWYHFMWICIMIGLVFFNCILLARKHNKKIDDIFIFSCGVLLFLIEGFKQILLIVDNGFEAWNLPYQFCTVPMYLALIAPLIKNEKIKNAMYKFLAIVGLAAGLSVMVYPESCLDTYLICLLIHTMLWHTTMVVMGIYLIVSKGYMQSLKDFSKDVIPALLTLYVFIAIAVIANFICNAFKVKVNFFYISPYFDTTFPVLNIVQDKTPYIVFLLSYIVSFSIVVCLTWLVVLGIKKIILKINKGENYVKRFN